MRDVLKLLLSSMLLATCFDAAAVDALPSPNWTRENAVQAAERYSPREVLAHWYLLAREGRGEVLLSEVRAFDAKSEVPPPARDRLLFELAVALGEFEPGTLEPQTLRYLAGRDPLAYVPHEEDPATGVPLYNVRAAASGSLAKWRRSQTVEAEKTSPLTSPERFIEAFPDSEPGERAALLRSARARFDSADLETIVLAARNMSEASTASLLLAELAPATVGRPAADELLFELLDHPQLGGAAALVLARSGHTAVLERLLDVAERGNDLAARRAEIALAAVSELTP